ncbi:hypothetical protein KSD_26800 [Ktedonobacter sp. SOSP1-85]|nr:hypothetical protein KSD_26800 [Ktedonobacter sp. SOSP1-85]
MLVQRFNRSYSILLVALSLLDDVTLSSESNNTVQMSKPYRVSVANLSQFTSEQV